MVDNPNNGDFLRTVTGKKYGVKKLFKKKRTKVKKRGWYGQSHEHSLAARGIKIYSQKKNLVDPVFYAQKREEQLPFPHIMGMARKGDTLMAMKRMHPKADAEDLRKRGIKAIGVRDADDTLSTLDNNGVDLTVKMAQQSPRFKKKAMDTLDDSQKRSFLKDEKADALKRRLGDVR